MAKTFFAIGGTDVTAYVDIQNYNVNKAEVLDEWTDGNRAIHRVVARTRVKGSFAVGFSRQADLDAFLALAAAKNVDGTVSCTAFCNNSNSTEAISAYLDLSGSGKWDLVNGRQWQIVNVEVTEK